MAREKRVDDALEEADSNGRKILFFFNLKIKLFIQRCTNRTIGINQKQNRSFSIYDFVQKINALKENKQ